MAETANLALDAIRNADALAEHEDAVLEVLAPAMADALRQMIVRCNCGIAIPCRPCFDADRILARYDGSVR